MKNIRFFYLKKLPFFGGKFSIYLNRPVFVMQNYESHLESWAQLFKVSLRVILLTVLAYSIHNILIFFAEKM